MSSPEPESTPAVVEPPAGDHLVDLSGPLRRYVASLVRDQRDVDDIVQETLVRMWQVSQRLEVETLSAYAFAVARNLVMAGFRSEKTARRHLPKLLDLNEPVRPDESAVTAETRHALASALDGLPPQRRAALVARDVQGRPLAEVAEEQNVTPNVLASQLHRTRAVLRLDYLLALRRTTLPTAACRPVLLAISSGDKRQQGALDAGDHLASCRACAELAPPLVTRDRALAGLVPWLPLGTFQGRVEGWLRRHPRTSVSAVVAATALVAGGVAAVASQSTDRAPADTVVAAVPSTSATGPPVTSRGPTALAVPNVTVDGQPLVAEPSRLTAVAGRTATASAAQVQAVPADEGFWVGTTGARVWVQFSGTGESPLRIDVGQVLDFTGQVTPNPPDFVSRVGLAADAGAAELQRVGYHLEVDPRAVRILR